MSSNHRAKLRRLRLLQSLAVVRPNPMGETGLLDRLLLDPELDPDLDKVRAGLDYLDWAGLVRQLNAPDVDWRAATLTDTGRQWLDREGDQGLEIHSPDYLPPAGERRGRHSTLRNLPPDARAWLDQLLDGGRTTYAALSQQLQARGYRITRSAVGRYGKKRKDKNAAIRARAEEKAALARSLAGVFSDASDIPALMQGALGTALVATVDAITEEQYDPSKDTLASLAGAIPKLGRGFRQAEQHKIEREARRQALAEAAAHLDDEAQASGPISADRLREIMRETYGV